MNDEKSIYIVIFAFGLYQSRPQQREHSLMDSQRVSSTQLFLVTPEKLCEVTLASYRKCAKLYADSKMYEMGHETVLSKGRWYIKAFKVMMSAHMLLAVCLYGYPYY